MKDRAEREQHYWLPPHVLSCPRIEGTVLLDLKQNRYFALSVSDSVALSRIVPNWPALPDHTACPAAPGSRQTTAAYAATLLKSGLLSAAQPTESTPMGEAKTPLASVGEEISEHVAINADHFYAFLRAYRWARRSVRRHSLNDIRQEVVVMRTAGHASATAPNEHEIAGLVSAFRTLRPFGLTAKDQCLVHSLALLKFLAHYQAFPTWIIGVTLRPWSAHSWIQLRELVLDSTPEKVCAFRPILVV